MFLKEILRECCIFCVLESELVCRTPGLTIENFRVSAGGADHALRVARKSTAEIIDRPAEG